MASEIYDIFGHELLYKVVENQIKKKDDVLITLVHWYFVKSGFRCIGTGDAKSFDSAETGSELLPEDWNQRPNYTLRYVKEGKLYLLIGTRSDADLLLNLMRIEDHSVSNVQFAVDTVVTSLNGQLPTLIPTFQAVINSIRTDLVDPVYTGNTRETSSQTESGNSTTEHNFPRRSPHDVRDYDPLRVEPPHRPSPGVPRWDPSADPRNVGRSDLDPFSGPSVGGGMLFDPFGPSPLGPRVPGGPGGLGVPGRLPPGAVPPGARFDPFGPPDINQPRVPRGPDNDHLPPPGYGDMFM